MNKFIAGGVSFALFVAPSAAQQSCPLVSYGQTCGATLGGTVALDGTQRNVTLILSGAAPSTFGLFAVGSTRVSFKLPGACSLLALPTVVLPFATDGAGRGSLRFGVDYQTKLLLYTQALVFVAQGGRINITASNGVRVGPWLGVRSQFEDFKTIAKRDPATTLAWLGNGSLGMRVISSSGVLGDFDVRFGGVNTKTKDAQGREIWEIDTTRVEIPASRTLTGKKIVVTNGVFEFKSFVVPANVHLRFKGSNVPHLVIAGDMQIDGVLSNSGRDAIKLLGSRGKPPKNGQAGFAGGAGGSAGGRGGDSPHRIGAKVINGSNGGAALAPRGHPLAAMLPGTPGRGSIANPASGLDANVSFTAYVQTISQQVTSGGGGGAMFGAGVAGAAIDNRKNGIYPPKAADIGKPTVGGKALNIASLWTRNQSSAFLYLLGGGAGGGGGAHPMGAFNGRPRNPVDWSPGGGGAGGAGPLHLRIVGKLGVGPAGAIHVRGGNGARWRFDSVNFTNPAPGGAGAGGGLVVQLLGALDVRGTVDVRGGLNGWLDGHGGVFNFHLRTDSLSGCGGDGYYRFEAPRAPNLAGLGRRLLPPPSPRNIHSAALRAVDSDSTGTAQSGWYDTGRAPALWHYYDIRAKIGFGPGDQIFSDNPVIGRKAVAGQPLVFEIQGARLDGSGKVLGSPTKWYPDLAGIQSDPNRGNGFRWRLKLDLTKAPGQVISVRSLRVVFDC